MPKNPKLGFRPIAAPGELQVSTPKDIAKRQEEKEYESWVKSKRRKLRNWHKHKDQYNAKRRAAAQSIEKRYEAAKRKALRRSQGWEFTPDEWEQCWFEAGWVRVPLTDSVVPAFALRGCNSLKNTYMQRKDVGKPWRPDNVRIMFRGEELKPGCRWYVEPPSHIEAQENR